MINKSKKSIKKINKSTVLINQLIINNIIINSKFNAKKI